MDNVDELAMGDTADDDDDAEAKFNDDAAEVKSVDGAAEVKFDTSGVPITTGYSGGFGFTQALCRLPMGVSVSRVKVDEEAKIVESTLEELGDLALANDSGKLMCVLYCANIPCRL